MELTLIGINESKQNMMSVLCSGVSQLKAGEVSQVTQLMLKRGLLRGE